MRPMLIAFLAILSATPAFAWSHDPSIGPRRATAADIADTKRAEAKIAKIAEVAAPAVAALTVKFEEAECYGKFEAEGLLYVCTKAATQQIAKLTPEALAAAGIALIAEDGGILVLDRRFALGEGLTAEQRIAEASVSLAEVHAGFKRAVRADQARKREAAAAESLRRMERALGEGPAHTLFY
jgi:hypothetical protein